MQVTKAGLAQLEELTDTELGEVEKALAEVQTKGASAEALRPTQEGLWVLRGPNDLRLVFFLETGTATAILVSVIGRQSRNLPQAPEDATRAAEEV